MKYLIDEDHWDLEGYAEEKEKLLNRFNKGTAIFLKNNSFHDGKVVSINILNKENGQTKDPTVIKMLIEQYSGELYEIQWINVRKFFMDYDITRNVYSNLPYKIVDGGKRGLDEWGYDEILPLSKKKLQHEILLFSQTTVIIHCSAIKIRKIKDVN
ncbi:hypothetical protein HF394_17775 [Planococcus glaciei]|uniref:Uncharacterized protein n=1 Tax=Planococcus glaciei TaxID=459472 RepID=A0A7H8QE28_9BACL|nr:hypothetical protein [Planococcus glaciei]QDY46617.1 hypothetical protein FK545_18540 [Planococcus glaciei]QKX52274.1 hypothetical protein HF394_17775 [Planococcus glaciei]